VEKERESRVLKKEKVLGRGMKRRGKSLKGSWMQASGGSFPDEREESKESRVS